MYNFSKTFWNSDYHQRFPLKSTDIWRYRIQPFYVLSFHLQYQALSTPSVMITARYSLHACIYFAYPHACQRRHASVRHEETHETSILSLQTTTSVIRIPRTPFIPRTAPVRHEETHETSILSLEYHDICHLNSTNSIYTTNCMRTSDIPRWHSWGMSRTLSRKYHELYHFDSTHSVNTTYAAAYACQIYHDGTHETCHELYQYHQLYQYHELHTHVRYIMMALTRHVTNSINSTNFINTTNCIRMWDATQNMPLPKLTRTKTKTYKLSLSLTLTQLSEFRADLQYRQDSPAEYRLFYRALLQKRPIL